jgi:hypothetical protein
MKSAISKKHIYQIFFDSESEKNLDRGFSALDNTENARPDWYEFWVIKKFLENNTLEEDAWYGFLSPKFFFKTGMKSETILQILDSVGDQGDVLLLGVAGWDQLSYFQNPFEQGNLWHPGLLESSQKFFDHINLQIDLRQLVSTTKDSVFSNYLIAKKPYWDQWIKLANLFFDTVENNTMPELGIQTSYGSRTNLAPLKTFIQERFPSIILSGNLFRVLSADHGESAPIFTRLFNDDLETRAILKKCDLLKQKYRITNDRLFLNEFYETRQKISFRNPMA